LNILKDANVAIVGPSSYLQGMGMGEHIDSFDLVVRINNLHESDDKHVNSDFGKRTDIIYYDGSFNSDRLSSYTRSNPKYIVCSYPECEWFFESRCREGFNTVKSQFESRIVQCDFYNKLKLDLDSNLKVRPNSGLIAILDLLSFPLKSLFITGIDFYRNSYASHHPDYGNIDLKTVKTIFKKGDGDDVHDINKQFKYFKKVFKKDSRLKTDEIMNKYITEQKYETVDF